MRQIRLVEYKQLLACIAPHQAEAKVRELGHQILRIAMNKGALDSFNAKAKPGGAMDKKKLDIITHEWKKYVTTELQPSAESGWDFVDAQERAQDAGEKVFVDADDCPLEYQDILTQGYEVGKSVRLKKRITGYRDRNAGDDKDNRKDVKAEQRGTITEIPKDDSKRLWVSFLVQTRRKDQIEIHGHVHVDDLELVLETEEATEAAAGAPTDGSASAATPDVYKKYPFLKQEQDSDPKPTIYAGWERQDVAQPKWRHERRLASARARVCLAMDCMNQDVGHTSKELLVVRRGNKVEVWTLVPFKKNKLVIVPFSTEIKDRYWTLGRSVLVPCAELKQMSKTLAIDGRLIGKLPAPESKEEKCLSMFWLVERTLQKEDANLHIEHVTTQVTVNMTTSSGTKRKFEQMSGSARERDTSMSMPVLMNPKDIEAHTKLVAMDDAEIHKLSTA